MTLIHSTHPPQDKHLVQLFLLLDTIKNEGASSIRVVAPYLARAPIINGASCFWIRIVGVSIASFPSWRARMDVGQSSTSYSYDNMNRLTQAGSTYHLWNDNGNLVGKYDGTDTWNYTYGYRDRLTSILLNGSWRTRNTSKLAFKSHPRR